MKALLILATVLFCAAAWAQTPYDLSDGRDLQALCQANTRDASLNALAHTFCFGYIRGVAQQAGLIKSERPCAPKAVSDEDMEKMVMKFLADNPKYMKQRPPAIISAALQAAFHCK